MTSLIPTSKKELKIIEKENKYEALLEVALREDFTDLQDRNIFVDAGLDFDGRNIVMFMPLNLPKSADTSEDLDRLLRFFIYSMHYVVQKEFTVIYFHSGFSWFSGKYFQWIRNVYATFTRDYKKNMQCLYVVHPTISMKSFFFFFRPFISSKFWKKLVYCENTLVLFEKLSPLRINIPDYVRNIDTARGVDVPRSLGLYFGVALMSQMPDHVTVPLIVKRCVEFIELNGIHVEGIYRLSAEADEIIYHKRQWDEGVDPLPDVHENSTDELLLQTTCGVLKSFLRELPMPLIPYKYYAKLIQSTLETPSSKTTNTDDGLLLTLDEVILDMPLAHRECLIYLLQHWVNISETSKHNKMTSGNLGVVFAPNILKAPIEAATLQVAMEMPMAVKVVKVMIENAERYLVLKTKC